MRRFISSFACIPFAIAALISAPASGAIVVEFVGLDDTDPVTDGIQLMPGDYLGVTANIFFQGDSLPANVNSVGLDLTWTASPGVTVSAISNGADPARFITAGTLADSSGLFNFASDLSTFNNSGTFLPQITAGDPAVTGRLGGAGFSDGDNAQWSGTMNSGSSGPVLLMSAQFDVTGDELSSLEFGVEGVFNPTFDGNGKFLQGGAPFSTATLTAGDEAFSNGTLSLASVGGASVPSISFVPEPGSAAGLLALVGLVSLRSRRRSS